MKLTSETKNQHFLSQVEQRLNASNPNAASTRKQRIFSFEVVDREKFQLRLENKNGRLISENLAIFDLFSFDVSPDRKLRLNFENLFERHEASVKINTENLLRKLHANNYDTSYELVNLFTSKLLNFTRNPFSIAKVLNTFGLLANYEPTTEIYNSYFEKIINGRKPHQSRLCAELGITDLDYINWLKMLFMLFLEYDEGNMSILEGTVKGLFESKQYGINVLVCTYNEANCLVSDRSFSTNIDQKGFVGFDFNLCSGAFIRYIFADIDTIAPPNAPKSLIENYKSMQKNITLYYKVDDMDLLTGYNTNVILQCHSRVYCASKDRIIGAI